MHVGGGFSLPLNPQEQLNFLHKVQRDLQTSVGDVGIIAFEYCSFLCSHPHPGLIFQLSSFDSRLSVPDAASPGQCCNLLFNLQGHGTCEHHSWRRFCGWKFSLAICIPHFTSSSEHPCACNVRSFRRRASYIALGHLR